MSYYSTMESASMYKVLLKAAEEFRPGCEMSTEMLEKLGVNYTGKLIVDRVVPYTHRGESDEVLLLLTPVQNSITGISAPTTGLSITLWP